RSLTGPECAATWSEALGVPVHYAGDDDTALDAALASHLSGHRLDDWRASLRKLRSFAAHASPEELAQTEWLLGRPPTDFTEFVRRVVDDAASADTSEAAASAAP
ncbi:MAG TPA: hypothetical protein VF143_13000, partial [Candidatus Nanopelagicales bacterium]